MAEGVHFRLDWIERRPRSATARSPARCRTSRRWARRAGEAYVALGVGGGLDAAGALELMRGAERSPATPA